MKQFVVLLFALAAIPSTTLSARADEKTDAFNACVKELASSEGISRNLLKTFRINKLGSGYQVTGQDENHQAVVCTTEGDRVTWVKVGG